MLRHIAVRGGQTFTGYDRYAEISVMDCNGETSGIKDAVARIDTSVLNREGDDYLFSTLYLSRVDAIALLAALREALK